MNHTSDAAQSIALNLIQPPADPPQAVEDAEGAEEFLGTPIPSPASLPYEYPLSPTSPPPPPASDSTSSSTASSSASRHSRTISAPLALNSAPPTTAIKLPPPPPLPLRSRIAPSLQMSLHLRTDGPMPPSLVGRTFPQFTPPLETTGGLLGLDLSANSRPRGRSLGSTPY